MSTVPVVTLAGPLLVLVGLLFVFLGARITVAGRRLTGRAPGTVVDLVRKSPGRTADSLLFPVIGWVAPDGLSYTFVGTFGAQPPRHRPGQPVEVAFDPVGRVPPQLAGTGRSFGLLFVGLGLAAVVAGVTAGAFL